MKPASPRNYAVHIPRARARGGRDLLVLAERRRAEGLTRCVRRPVTRPPVRTGLLGRARAESAPADFAAAFIRGRARRPAA
jgi:hypothetical protein